MPQCIEDIRCVWNQGWWIKCFNLQKLININKIPWFPLKGRSTLLDGETCAVSCPLGTCLEYLVFPPRLLDMLILALFLTQKQNPFCREPRFVKAGRSRISIRTVWLENETTIKEILNSGPMIKRQLPGWYAKEAYWRLSWTLGTTFKTEAVELNPADWHKKLPLPPPTCEKCFFGTSKTPLVIVFFSDSSK